jgi:Protein of unknown function (DUF4238)
LKTVPLAHIRANMNLPRKHHHNPQFVLRRWVGTDGLLCAMRLVNGRVVAKRVGPRGTGFVDDLYRTDGIAEENSQDLEIKFMSPLDHGAATAMRSILAGKSLTVEERAPWARFLLSMLFRHPEGVGTIKTHTEAMWAEATAALEATWAANRAPGNEMTFAEATAKREPGAVGTSAANLLADIMGNSRAVPDICKMRWTCVDLSKSPLSLLTSDRPLVMPFGLDNPKAYLALPLGPHQLFVAAYGDQYAKALRAHGHQKIVKIINKDVVRQARERVWATDDANIEFVRKHIGKAPERIILTDEQRQEILAAARGDEAA